MSWNWTDERTALLRKFWAEGLSAAQISKQLGGVSRNAVIGKVHRLGLAGRATPARPAKRPVRHVVRPWKPPTPAVAAYQATARTADKVGLKLVETKTEHQQAVERSAALAPVLSADGKPFTVATIDKFTCRFPVGDPADSDFAFCGRATGSGCYCPDHAKLCNPPVARKRRAGYSRVTAKREDKLRQYERAAGY